MRKPIPGYDRYEIDDTGKVFNIVTGKELKLSVNSNKYLSVELFSAPGVSKRLLVHRLVAQAFIPNEKGLPIINHKDENPQNNHVANLEWCSYKYNVNYGNCQKKKATSLATFYASEKIKEIGRQNGKAVCKIVDQFDRNGNLIASFVSGKEASVVTGVNHSHIFDVCRGRRKSAGGYLWAYGRE